MSMGEMPMDEKEVCLGGSDALLAISSTAEADALEDAMVDEVALDDAPVAAGGMMFVCECSCSLGCRKSRVPPLEVTSCARLLPKALHQRSHEPCQAAHDSEPALRLLRSMRGCSGAGVPGTGPALALALHRDARRPRSRAGSPRARLYGDRTGACCRSR
ncbi:hypothetical protein L1887_47078 [Cichorium endivia]|nr:hypothetical protein L1887_47078 [Cichorium endivia]